MNTGKTSVTPLPADRNTAALVNVISALSSNRAFFTEGSLADKFVLLLVSLCEKTLDAISAGRTGTDPAVERATDAICSALLDFDTTLQTPENLEHGIEETLLKLQSLQRETERLTDDLGKVERNRTAAEREADQLRSDTRRLGSEVELLRAQLRQRPRPDTSELEKLAEQLNNCSGATIQSMAVNVRQLDSVASMLAQIIERKEQLFGAMDQYRQLAGSIEDAANRLLNPPEQEPDSRPGRQRLEP